MATSTAAKQRELLDKAAIGCLIISPIIMLLPPRKMDKRILGLTFIMVTSSNYLAESYTGKSIYTRFGNRVVSLFTTELNDNAKRTQRLLKEQKERETGERGPLSDAAKTTSNSVLKEIWLGGEGEDWKEKRAAEHRREFEEGKSISDVILGQVSDVFSGNWGKNANKDEETPTAESTEQHDNEKPWK